MIIWRSYLSSLKNPGEIFLQVSIIDIEKGTLSSCTLTIFLDQFTDCFPRYARLNFGS